MDQEIIAALNEKRDGYAEMCEEFIPTPAPSYITCHTLKMLGFKPNVVIPIDGRPKELISYPFVRDWSQGIACLVREVDDPTTMKEWRIPPHVIRAAYRAGARTLKETPNEQIRRW
jgi:hypothetical protein